MASSALCRLCLAVSLTSTSRPKASFSVSAFLLASTPANNSAFLRLAISGVAQVFLRAPLDALLSGSVAAFSLSSFE